MSYTQDVGYLRFEHEALGRCGSLLEHGHSVGIGQVVQAPQTCKRTVHALMISLAHWRQASARPLWILAPQHLVKRTNQNTKGSGIGDDARRLSVRRLWCCTCKAGPTEVYVGWRVEEALQDAGPRQVLLHLLCTCQLVAH